MNPLPKPGVRAVIFDISGTTIDYGSRGPVVAFVELFARHGVTITEAEARFPMGLHKRDHIQALLSDPAIAARWRDVHGAAPDASTLDRLYPEFAPVQIEALQRHADVLPGIPELTAALRARGIRIGSTTGFDSNMMAGLTAAAAAQGYQPDCWVCPDHVGAGRPAPWMIFHAARLMNVYPLRTFIKVGDTAADIEEARNAGVWAVSVVKTGNEIGLSRDQWDSLPAPDQSARLSAAREKFLSLGAHYVIDSAAELLPIAGEISARIENGDRP
jgi:phosphonoacetaldehyde hydrolase